MFIDVRSLVLLEKKMLQLTMLHVSSDCYSPEMLHVNIPLSSDWKVIRTQAIHVTKHILSTLYPLTDLIRLQ